MPTTIEQLELELQANSTSAVSGINALTSSLERLKTAARGGVGLTAVARQITAVGNAARTLIGADFSPLSMLATSLRRLSSVGNINLNPTINQLSRVPELATKLSSVDTGAFGAKISEITAALRPLSELPKQNISTALTQLKRLPQIAQDLNGIDMAALKTKIQEVVDAIRPLSEAMGNVAAGFSAFPTRIQRLISSTNGLSRANNRASASYVNIYARIKMAASAVKGIATKIATAITKMNDYIEDINLFTASMGEYAEGASQFAEKVGSIMGIDPGEWMRNQGVFMTLATGFGVVGDRAYTMSQQLTQLGYDLSSFFNISYEAAMQKLQSGISGELEPLRRLGYDLSQAKLQSVALSLGIDKAVSSMTQAEKAQLRYYAIMTQVTTAQGDMARTLDAPANQLRIFKAQVAQAARAIGSIFIPALNAVLPYAIAAAEVIRYLAETIASLFGFKMPEVDYSSIKNNASGIGDAFDDASDSAKKLKSYLLGIDELNVINPNEGQGSAADSVLGQFDFELPTYDFIGEATKSRVSEIVEEMKEWLGLTDDIDSWSELLDTRLGDILKTAGLIGTAIAGWKITKATIDTISALKDILSNPSYAIAIGVTLTITGFSLEFSGIKDSIQKGLDKFNFSKIIGGAMFGTGGSALLGSKIASWITSAFGSSKIAAALAKAAANLGVGTAGAAGAAIGGGIAGIIAGIPMYIAGIYNAIKDGINWMSGTLIGVGATAVGAGIGTIIGACGGPIGAGIGALIGLAVGLITDFTTWLWQNFEDVERWFRTLPDWAQIALGAVKIFCGGIFSVISDIISLIKNWDMIVDGFNNIPKAWDALWENWDIGAEAIKSKFQSVGKSIIDGIVEGWQTVWKAITDFVDRFVQGFKDALGIHSPSKVFEEIGDNIVAGLLQGIEGFVDMLGTVAEWAGSVVEWFRRGEDGMGIVENFKVIGGNIVSGFKDKIGSAYITVKNNIITWASNVKEWFSGSSYGGVNSITFLNYASNVIDGFKNGISNSYKTVQSVMNTFGSSVKSWFTSNVSYSKFYDVAADVVRGFKNGIGELYKTCQSTISDWGSSIITWFKAQLKSHSPSKVFEQIGQDTVLGYNIGISDLGKTTKGIVNEWASSFTSVSPVMSFAVDTSALRYYNTDSFAKSVSADVTSNTSVTATGFKEGMEEFYREYIEPTMAQMAADMRRQADKNEQTVVQIGTRTISEAVSTQQKANGFAFVK